MDGALGGGEMGRSRGEAAAGVEKEAQERVDGGAKVDKPRGVGVYDGGHLSNGGQAGGQAAGAQLHLGEGGGSGRVMGVEWCEMGCDGVR